MRRFVAAVAVCVAAALGVVVCQAPAVADPECMFSILDGLGATDSCPDWSSLPGGGPGASPNVAPADDRVNATPTSWWTYYGVDATGVSNLLNANGARPTDIRVLSASPLRFSVTMVRNLGAYQSGYWWYYGITMTQVNSFLSANNARLISAVRYGNVYAVVMVPNTGPNARAWGWCDTDFAGIGTCVGTNARLITLEAYAANRFVIIFVANTENYGWCWYVGTNRDGLAGFCGGQSIVDVSANPDGSLNVVSVAAPQQDAVGVFDSPDSVVGCGVDNATRPLFTAPYQSAGATFWVASFAYNS
jgi:hypothetical protein